MSSRLTPQPLRRQPCPPSSPRTPTTPSSQRAKTEPLLNSATQRASLWVGDYTNLPVYAPPLHLWDVAKNGHKAFYVVSIAWEVGIYLHWYVNSVLLFPVF